MNKDEMTKNDNYKLMDLLYRLKSGELCTPNCFGCCGDDELSFTYCPATVTNFEKELINLGYCKITKEELYARAIKEFAEMLKEDIAIAIKTNTDALKLEDNNHVHSWRQGKIIALRDTDRVIDYLLKEVFRVETKE